MLLRGEQQSQINPTEDSQFAMPQVLKSSIKASSQSGSSEANIQTDVIKTIADSPSLVQLPQSPPPVPIWPSPIFRLLQLRADNPRSGVQLPIQAGKDPFHQGFDLPMGRDRRHAGRLRDHLLPAPVVIYWSRVEVVPPGPAVGNHTRACKRALVRTPLHSLPAPHMHLHGCPSFTASGTEERLGFQFSLIRTKSELKKSVILRKKSPELHWHNGLHA